MTAALALLLVALSAAPAAAQSAPVIEAVRVGGADGRLVVEIVATTPLGYLVVDTPDPFTVTLFLARTTFAFAPGVRELDTGPLRRVAGVVLDRPDGLLARLDLVFAYPVDYRVTGQGRRLVVRVEVPAVPDAVVLGTLAPDPLEARSIAPPAEAGGAVAPAPGPSTAPAPAVVPPATAAARVLRITPVNGGETVRVAVEAEQPLIGRAFTLQDPPRLVVDFDNVVTSLGRFTLAVGGRVLERIRASQFRPAPHPVVRIVLDLRRLVPYRVESGPHGAVIHLGP
jgi:hypothetical protein